MHLNRKNPFSKYDSHGWLSSNPHEKELESVIDYKQKIIKF